MQPSPKKSLFSRIVSFTGTLVFFSVPVVLLLVGLVVWKTSFLFGAIEPEKASPFQILLLLCVRDMENQPQETVDRILARLEETVGPSSGEMVELKMNSFVRKIVTGELTRRRNDIAGYTLFATASGGSQAAEKNEEILAKTKPLAERNILFLFKSWYIREMNRCNSASDREKQAILQKFVDELKWWGRFSENVYKACDIPPLSLLEMGKEYEMTFEYYRRTTDPPVYQKMLVFRDKLQAAFVVSETKNRVNQFLGPLWGK